MVASGASWGAWLYVTASLLLVSLAAFAAGLWWTRARRGDALREATADALALAALLDGALWRSDAQHRLRPLRSPAATIGNAGDAAALLPDGRALWEHFVAADGAPALQRRLEAQQPFGPMRVQPATSAPRTPAAHTQVAEWLLRGQPCFDAEGRFDGYLGSLRPAADEAGPGAALVDALLAAGPGARLLARRDPAGGGWRVCHANAAALERFGTAAGAMPAWDAVRERLPAAAREALDGPATGDGAEPAGWLLHRIVLPGADRHSGGFDSLLLAESAVTGDNGAPNEQASFSYTVSHDLRAPIRVVEGFTRILKEDYGPRLDRVGNEHLDRVLGAAARMTQMIDAMLTLARLSTQPLARQPVNLSQLAGYIVDDLVRGAPERDAEVEIEPGLIARGDPTLLRLVLENLLGNAWKYTQRTPRARIAVAAEAQPAGRCGFVVRDNGAGFDMRSAERLFGLFQRLHSASEFPGTGVGLASVKRIVQRHGGDIWAEAEPGRGAAFHVTLRE
jgi:signal transduction histidine kinase